MSKHAIVEGKVTCDSCPYEVSWTFSVDLGGLAPQDYKPTIYTASKRQYNEISTKNHSTPGHHLTTAISVTGDLDNYSFQYPHRDKRS